MLDHNGRKQQTRHILVVSGNTADLQFIKKHIEPAGFDIWQAGNCDEAYEIITKQDIDLLILDVTEAGDEAESFCTLLHNRDSTAPIPVVAITGSEDIEKRGQIILNAGADDFLSHPLKMPALLVRIRTLLRLKDLHENVSRRNAELETVNQELASRNRELEQGLEMAHRLQNTLLPQQYPRVKNVSFYHIYTPADAIGGDIFQIAPLSGDRAVVLLCDVSGHGIRAALVTSILTAVFEHVYLEDKNAAQILSDINARFRSIMGSLSPHIYATAFVMIVNGKEQSISLASAGHVCPFLISKQKMTCKEAISPEKVGPALGFFPNPSYEHEERKLDRADIVLGFTDGIFEVVNDRSEIYGMGRLQKLIEKNIHLVPRDMIERILRATDEFRRNRKRPDDICMVAVEMH